MICRHCGIRIWKRSSGVWGDGRLIVCNMRNYNRHEPDDRSDDEVFNDLRMIIQSLEPVDPRLL